MKRCTPLSKGHADIVSDYLAGSHQAAFLVHVGRHKSFPRRKIPAHQKSAQKSEMNKSQRTCHIISDCWISQVLNAIAAYPWVAMLGHGLWATGKGEQAAQEAKWDV